MVNYLRKTWLALSLILLCTGVHAAIYNGTSGGTNWTVDTDTGVLTISKGEKYEGEGGWLSRCPDYDAGVTHDYDTEWEDGYGVSCEKNVENTAIFGGDNREDWHKYSSQITSIVVEEGVTEIGNAAFRKLSNVTSVSLPTTLTTVGLEAFRGCSKLDSIYIPKNVCTLKDRWATDCSELSVIEIDPENQCYFVDQYGAVYDADTTTLVKLPQDMTIGELVIPRGCDRICYRCLVSTSAFDASDVAFYHDFRKVWFIGWFGKIGENLF